MRSIEFNELTSLAKKLCSRGKNKSDDCCKEAVDGVCKEVQDFLEYSRDREVNLFIEVPDGWAVWSAYAWRLKREWPSHVSYFDKCDLESKKAEEFISRQQYLPKLMSGVKILAFTSKDFSIDWKGFVNISSFYSGYSIDSVKERQCYVQVRPSEQPKQSWNGSGLPVFSSAIKLDAIFCLLPRDITCRELGEEEFQQRLGGVSLSEILVLKSQIDEYANSRISTDESTGEKRVEIQLQEYHSPMFKRMIIMSEELNLQLKNNKTYTRVDAVKNDLMKCKEFKNKNQEKNKGANAYVAAVAMRPDVILSSKDSTFYTDIDSRSTRLEIMYLAAEKFCNPESPDRLTPYKTMVAETWIIEEIKKLGLKSFKSYAKKMARILNPNN